LLLSAGFFFTTGLAFTAALPFRTGFPFWAGLLFTTGFPFFAAALLVLVLGAWGRLVIFALDLGITQDWDTTPSSCCQGEGL